MQSTQETMQAFPIQGLGTKGSPIILSPPSSPETHPQPKCTRIEWSPPPMPRSPIRDPFATHFYTNLHELFTTIDQLATLNNEPNNEQNNEPNNEQNNEPNNEQNNEQENEENNEENNREDDNLQDPNQQTLQDTLLSYPFDPARAPHKDLTNPRNTIALDATQFCIRCGSRGTLPVPYYLFEPGLYCRSCAHDLIWESRTEEAANYLSELGPRPPALTILAIAFIHNISGRDDELATQVEFQVPELSIPIGRALDFLQTKQDALYKFHNRSSVQPNVADDIQHQYKRCSMCYFIGFTRAFACWERECHHHHEHPNPHSIYLCLSCYDELVPLAILLRCPTQITLGREPENAQEQELTVLRMYARLRALACLPRRITRHPKRADKIVYEA